MIGKIATAAVYVEDQQAALGFWTEQVGFEIRTRLSMGPSGHWLEVGPKGAESCLVVYPRSMMEDCGKEALHCVRGRRYPGHVVPA